MKKLGIIGGMGPEATSFFYARITGRTKASCDQEHLDIVILSHASMPDRTHAILTGDKSDVLEAATKDIRALEMLGVENIAIPCNTFHYFLEDLQKETKIPIINMLEETVKAILKENPNVKKIGIMGTDGTLRAGTYFRVCEKMGVMALIYDEIKSGKPADETKFVRAYEDLKQQGCDAVILACTEISVYKEYHEVPKDCIDAMDILVKESILRSGAELKEASYR